MAFPGESKAGAEWREKEVGLAQRNWWGQTTEKIQPGIRGDLGFLSERAGITWNPEWGASPGDLGRGFCGPAWSLRPRTPALKEGA